MKKQQKLRNLQGIQLCKLYSVGPSSQRLRICCQQLLVVSLIYINTNTCRLRDDNADICFLFRRGSRGGETGEFSPPFFWAPFFLLFFLIPQILIGSNTLLQKFTPISKSWIRACYFWHFLTNCWKFWSLLFASYNKNKRKKFYTTFRWLHVIIFKWKENKIDNIIYTVQGDKT